MKWEAIGLRKFYLVGIFCFVLIVLAGCGGPETVEVVAPVQMEIPTDHIQPRMGISGFILGTYGVVVSFFIILGSCLLMVIKDDMAENLRDGSKTFVKLVYPMADDSGKFFSFMNKITSSDERARLGTLGLFLGFAVAYIGARIAM